MEREKERGEGREWRMSGEMKVRRKGSSSDWRGDRGEEGGRKKEERREEGREEEEVERMEEVTEISMTQLNLDSTYMQ